MLSQLLKFISLDIYIYGEKVLREIGTLMEEQLYIGYLLARRTSQMLDVGRIFKWYIYLSGYIF